VNYELLRPHTLGKLRRLHIGLVELDIDGVQVRINGLPVPLPRKEYGLLRELMENAGQVRTRRQLLDAVWGEGHKDVNKAVESHIQRLRRRIASAGGSSDFIRTVRGAGYVIDVAPPGLSS
jgi:DNA-binding response OmpR family regulator